MFRRNFFLCILIVIGGSLLSAQAKNVRDYTALINQTYYSGVVDYMKKIQDEFEKAGNLRASKSVEQFLNGPFGSGFVYVDSKGNNFILTNNHVINQADQLKVSFEKQDGTRKTYEGLKVLAVDEDLDIAILKFADGDKPFGAGLTVLNRQVDEGEEVFTAGFPALGINPVWQFASGIVSNISVKIPKSMDDDEKEFYGPFIQHTAPVDGGNSGGPLLVAQQGAVSGFAVAGINTRKAYGRENASYAIPSVKVLEFINRALNPGTEDPRAALEKRVNAFIDTMKKPEAAYPHMTKYLSNPCVADNADLAFDELNENAHPIIWAVITNHFEYSPVEGMQYAVAWLIENSMRSTSVLGNIKIAVKEITQVSNTEYNVVFTINEKDVSTSWINEYTIWRIKSFGDAVTGDKTIVEQREKERQEKLEGTEKLKSDFSSMFQIGATYMTDMGDKSMAFNAGVQIHGKVFLFGFDYIGNSAWKQFQVGLGLMYPIRIGSDVAIMPLGQFCGNLAFPGVDFDDDATAYGWGIKAGFVVTTSLVKGLYLHATYQYNGETMSDMSGYSDDKIKFSYSFLTLGIGYAFYRD